MVANRTTPTIGNTPGGISGEDYAQRVYEEVVALWNYVGGALTSVAGTNTITASASPSITSYVSGAMFSFMPAASNTGAATININGLGAKSIRDALGNVIAAGDLVVGKMTDIRYDGTNFRIVSNSTLVSTAMGRLVLSHELANGVDGGTATSGSEQTYPWDKVCQNTIAGASVSLATEEFTLPAGSYEGEFIATIYDVDAYMFRLYNVTDGVYEDASACVFLNGIAGDTTNNGFGMGKIILNPTSAKTYKVVYRVQTTKTSTGLGFDNALFTSVEQFGYLAIRATSSSTGSAGTSIRTTNGVPASGLGSEGDLAIDYTTGNLYEKSAGAYVLRGSLKGGVGNDGADGASFLSGSGVPSDALGADGDTYVDLASAEGDTYFKSGGAWAATGFSIKGPPGDPGVHSDEITLIKKLTQVEYDAIPVKSATTMYIIMES